MKHEGRSYAEVVATDDDFVREMSKVLEAKLPDDILARYNGRGPPASTPSNEPGHASQGAGRHTHVVMPQLGGGVGETHITLPAVATPAVCSRVSRHPSRTLCYGACCGPQMHVRTCPASCCIPCVLLSSDVVCNRQAHRRRCAAAASVRRTGGSMGVVQGGVESTCSHKGTLVEMSGGGAPATRQKALGARGRSLSHAPSAVQSTEARRRRRRRRRRGWPIAVDIGPALPSQHACRVRATLSSTRPRRAPFRSSARSPSRSCASFRGTRNTNRWRARRMRRRRWRT